MTNRCKSVCDSRKWNRSTKQSGFDSKAEFELLKKQLERTLPRLLKHSLDNVRKMVYV